MEAQRAGSVGSILLVIYLQSSGIAASKLNLWDKGYLMPSILITYGNRDILKKKQPDKHTYKIFSTTFCFHCH
jgi:hypothetical protein